MRKHLLFLFLLPLLASAQSESLWRLALPSAGGTIPLHILLQDNHRAFAINADEKLEFDQVVSVGDTLHLRMELYDFEIIAVIRGKQMQGVFNKRGSDMLYRQVAFTGTLGDTRRFITASDNNKSSLASKYKITFKSVTSGKESPGLGVFEVKDDAVTGSFLSQTGDYRFLQGNVIGDSLYLSALGSTAMLYKARIKGDSLVGGVSFSPFGAGSSFEGVRDDQYTMPDGADLTYLKEGYDRFDFSFTDLHGRTVALSDPRYKGKVTVVQLLGTWCPNCLDETRFLMEYRKENPQLEVIGLAFERNDDPSFANPKIARFIERFKVDYPVLLAGSTANAGEKLPQLNHVMAFPTSIVVDKRGVVRKIHTGFTGPGTGSYYETYIKEFKAFVEKLQAE